MSTDKEVEYVATIRTIEQKMPELIKRKRVAAYARVSVEMEQSMKSLSAQVSYYSSLIQNNPEWEYAGVYADKGISGTSTACRDGFNRMIADCEAGKIDMILVKSISRFARNTVDLLGTVRHLKSLGIEVRFEREGISTFSGDGELLLTILASFAQEESRSISENEKWAIVKGYREGRSHSPTRTYGYEWNGENYVIVPEEAGVVRFIFKTYLSGKSPHRIAGMLNEKGIPSLKGGLFCQETITDMIKNEIFMGNLVFQKTFSVDVGKRVRNHGEMPMYRVEEAHEPIVSRELFDAVQEERRRRGEKAANLNSEITGFSGKVKCGKCGGSCSRRNIPHSSTTQRDHAKRWVCIRMEKKHQCDLRPISEDELRRGAAEILGTDPSDDEAFRSRIGRITVYDGSVEFLLKDGRTKTWERSFTRKDSVKTCFSGKLYCGDCGSPMVRNTIRKKPDMEYNKAWTCRRKKKAAATCGSVPLPEDELRSAAALIFGNGKDYEMRFACEVERVTVYKETFDFHMKDGRIETWQRE